MGTQDELSRPWWWASTAAKAMIVMGVLAFVAGALIQYFGYGHSFVYVADGHNMKRQYRGGDLIAAEPIEGRDVRHGDIIVVPDPEKDPDRAYAARVIALGGDTLSYRQGAAQLTINGAPLDEPYLPKGAPAGGTSDDFAVTVPNGKFIAMDDTRDTGFAEGLTASDGSGAWALSLIESRVVASSSDPSVLLAIGEFGARGSGPYLTPIGAVLLVIIRIKLSRVRAKAVYPWSTP
ncbi:signal peptidase I [Streptomyces sp. NPDC051183]|uniref:signal peptidase I n=1 Tax=Streptomyces sp. NPDC051183 TaxID=3155165 RepID=UPI0034157329